MAFNSTRALEALSSLMANGLMENPGLPNLITVLLVGGLTAIVVFYYRKPLQTRSSSPKQATSSTGPDNKEETLVDRELNKDRQAGEWNPEEFRYPLPIEACPDKLAEVKPIPYRPFRWGPYHVTMGIRNMTWNDWIELDKGHAKYHEIKSHRMKLHGQGAVRVLNDQANPEVVKGGEEAAVELVHELAEYLSRRYPRDFQVVRHSTRTTTAATQDPDQAFCDWGWEGLPPIRTVRMTSLKVAYELPISVDDGVRAPERAMEIAGLMIQDDLALMLEGVDGRYYFQAGSICLPGFWRLQDKIGLLLDDIHITGNVPQYKERLQTSLERFFRRLPVDKPVVRNNYFFQTNRRESEGADVVDGEELGWAVSTVGSEGEFEHGTAFKANPEEEIQKGEQEKGGEQGEIKVEWIRLRSERQTLRRLPRSGAVVFTIRTYLTPVGALVEEPDVAGRMASALRSWPEDVGEYKGKNRGGWYLPLIDYLEARK